MSEHSSWSDGSWSGPEADGDGGAEVALLSLRRAELASSYAGEWVAVSHDWQQLYAHGASYLAVCAGAVARGARNPLIARLP